MLECKKSKLTDQRTGKLTRVGARDSCPSTIAGKSNHDKGRWGAEEDVNLSFVNKKRKKQILRKVMLQSTLIPAVQSS